MQQRTRKILFYIFTLAFFVITSFLIIYAQGYKFSLSWPLKYDLIFQKTGILILDTEPRGALVYIDGKPQGSFFNILKRSNVFDKTPIKIKNLTPGEYSIKLELEGYWPWEKKLQVKPGESTFAEDIVLFRRDLPELIASDIKALSGYQNKLLFVFDNQDGFDLINENNENFQHISSSTSGEILFSQVSDYYLIKTDKTLKLFDSQNNEELLDLFNYTDRGISSINWYENKPDVIYYQLNDALVYFDIESKINYSIYKDTGIIDFLIKQNKLYLITDKSDACQLSVLNIDSLAIEETIDLPCSNDLRFANPENPFINIIDYKHEILYIIEPKSQFNKLKKIVYNINKSFWIDDEKLLFSNDFEIWLDNVNTNSKSLITRISDPISKIIWHPSDNYIIYSTERTINIIELDDREKRIITELTKLDKIKDLYLNNDGNILYFVASIGTQQGLYKLYLK